MSWRIVNQDVAGRLFDGRCPVYSNTAFVELNRSRAGQVSYLAWSRDDNQAPAMGIVLGERDGMLCSPFSAPFGGLVRSGEMPDQADVMKAVAELADVARDMALPVQVTLPPAVYDPAFVEAQQLAFGQHFRLLYNDVNYHFDLGRTTDVLSVMHRNPRRNYRASFERDYRFERLTRSAGDIARAYAVIRANREARGYPLRMTLEAVTATAPVVDGHFGVLTLDGRDIAAVQLHRVTDTVIQVVYWGNIPDEDVRVRPMSRLVVETLEWCRELGARIVDIGPSSEHGVPSPGLCAFKEAHGCEAQPKMSYMLDI